MRKTEFSSKVEASMNTLRERWTEDATLVLMEDADLEQLLDIYESAYKEVMQTATRYLEVAEKCRQLLAPDDSITKLEKALEEAKRQQVEAREKDLAELQALI